MQYYELNISEDFGWLNPFYLWFVMLFMQFSDADPWFSLNRFLGTHFTINNLVEDFKDRIQGLIIAPYFCHRVLMW